MTRTQKLLAALGTATLLAACTDAAKVPAEAAMKAAETAMADLKGEVLKLAPDQVKAAQAAFASAKEKIGKEDYKGALAAAGEIPAQVKAALAAAAAKKEALAKAFNEAVGSLPSMAAAIKSRLDILSQAKKLPAGIDKAGLDKAKEGLAGLESGIAKATEQFKGGAMDEAIAQAKEVKAKGTEIMKAIGLGQ